jgi:hypothetical protein
MDSGPRCSAGTTAARIAKLSNPGMLKVGNRSGVCAARPDGHTRLKGLSRSNKMRLTYENISDAGTRFAKGHSPRHVFVFGAGLSMPAGPPSAFHLLKRATLWNLGARKPLNTNLVDSFCDYFYPSLIRAKGQFPDAEDMLGLMEAAKDYDSIRGRGRGYRWRKGYLLDARTQLVRLLSEFLWSFQNENTFRKIQFIRNLVRGHPTHTVFVTFNYDLLLEQP